MSNETEPFNGWQQLEKIGEGGQGEVFRVRRIVNKKSSLGESNWGQFYSLLRETDKPSQTGELGKRISSYLFELLEQNQVEYGALKRLKLDGREKEADLAKERLNREFDAMKAHGGRNLIPILDSPKDGKIDWFITPFFASGTLANRPRHPAPSEVKTACLSHF